MTDFKVITGTKKLNALSLFVPILLVFLVLRVAVIILSGYEFGEVLIIRAVVSDICIAAVVALLISLVPIRILQFVLGSLVVFWALQMLNTFWLTVQTWMWRFQSTWQTPHFCPDLYLPRISHCL